MLFKYNFVNHDAEILQKLIEHIVLDVWCNAKGKNFNLNKIKEENNFREIVKTIIPQNVKTTFSKILFS